MHKYSGLSNTSKQVVILKLACMPGPITASIVEVEQEGLWFTSASLFGDGSGLSEEVKKALAILKPPVCFVPRERIDYIVASGS